MASVTTAQRFALRDVRLASKPGSIRDIACRVASYWESFPGSYSDDQVVAAVALHHDPDDALAVLRVYLLRECFECGIYGPCFTHSRPTVMVPGRSRWGGNRIATCPTCGLVCGHWDDDDLNEDGELECSRCVGPFG